MKKSKKIVVVSAVLLLILSLCCLVLWQISPRKMVGYVDNMDELQALFGFSCNYLDFNVDGPIYCSAVFSRTRGFYYLEAFAHSSDYRTPLVIAKGWGERKDWPLVDESCNFISILPPDIMAQMHFHIIDDDTGYGYITDYRETPMDNSTQKAGLLERGIRGDNYDGLLYYSLSDGRIVLVINVYGADNVSSNGNYLYRDN